jgi:hypothetical protein
MNDQVLNTGSKSAKNLHWKSRGDQHIAVSPGVFMIPAKAEIDLRGILGCHQIVSHGDGWQQNKEEQCQGNELNAAIGRAARRKMHPETDHEYGQQRPGKIEDELHSLCRFYNRRFKWKECYVFHLDARLRRTTLNLRSEIKCKLIKETRTDLADRCAATRPSLRFDPDTVCPYNEGVGS